jgi:hypothetical protein
VCRLWRVTVDVAAKSVALGVSSLEKTSELWIPPAWVRRLVLAPIVWVACLLITVASPVLHVVLALADVVDRRSWRFTRLGGLGIAFCVTEFIGLTLAFVLWVASGFGWKTRSPAVQRANNRLFGWWLELVTRALTFYLGFELVVRGDRITGPILAFARHAGPGDMFLLARTLIQTYDRQMITVGASKLLLDPFFDRVSHRLPSCFLDQNPKDPAAALDELAELCATMSDDSVMIICPEGGNWTPRRWRRAIERLEARGQHEQAQQAVSMTHVLPPRTAGAVAALRARDDITVVFIAHVGLDDLFSLRELWRKIPLRRQVEVGYWSVPRDQIPTERDQLSAWLFAEWKNVDDWIDHRRTLAIGH